MTSQIKDILEKQKNCDHEYDWGRYHFCEYGCCKWLECKKCGYQMCLQRG